MFYNPRICMPSGLNFDKQMGRISKYSNLYDKDNNLLHSPGNYTVQECEKLVDKLAEEDKDNSTQASRRAYENTMAVLMSMYEKYGNPHKDEIIQKLNDTVKSHTTKAEVIEALNDTKAYTSSK